MRFLNKNFFIKFLLVDLVFFVVFYVAFVVTFPIEEIVEGNKRLITEKTQKKLKYASISLGFDFSIQVDHLELTDMAQPVNTSKKLNNKNNDNPKEEKKPAVLKIKHLSLSPNISDMMSTKKTNVDFYAEMMNGTLEGNFSVVEEAPKAKKSKNARRAIRKKEKNKLQLSVKSLNLMLLSEYLGLELPYGGKLTGDVNTEFSTVNGKPVISKLMVDLDMVQAVVGPGKVKAMGSFVTIDAIRLDNFHLKGQTEKNRSRFKLEPLKIDSKDLKADLSGTITFARSIMPNLKLKFKFTDELLKTNKKVKAVMGGFSSMKRKDGYFGMKLTGTLKHLRQRPWKR